MVTYCLAHLNRYMRAESPVLPTLEQKTINAFNSFYKKLKSTISKHITYMPGHLCVFSSCSASVAGMRLDAAERPYSLRRDVMLEQNQSEYSHLVNALSCHFCCLQSIWKQHIIEYAYYQSKLRCLLIIWSGGECSPILTVEKFQCIAICLFFFAEKNSYLILEIIIHSFMTPKTVCGMQDVDMSRLMKIWRVLGDRLIFFQWSCESV